MGRIIPAMAVLSLVLGALLVAIAKRPAPPSVPSVAAPTARDDRGQASIVVNVVSIERDAFIGVYGGGTYRFKLAPGAALPSDLKRGEALLAHCRLTPGGGWIVERAERHHGLPIDYGTVARRDDHRLELKTALGENSLVVTHDSYIPAQISDGDFVAVKYYHIGDNRVVLSCLLMPGCSVEEGIVTAVGPSSFSLRGLRGVVTFDVYPDKLEVGDAVTFRYSLDANDRVLPLRVEPRDGRFSFSGKLVRNAPGMLTVLDVLGNMGDNVDFRYEGDLTELRTTRPGDLLQVTYELPEAGGARLVSVQKVPLPPVYFGTITQIDESRLTLVTRQGQTKEVRLSRATVMPVRVKAGDMADVIYREEAGALPLATTVVKE